jgi:hypothetical protein
MVADHVHIFVILVVTDHLVTGVSRSRIQAGHTDTSHSPVADADLTKVTAK